MEKEGEERGGDHLWAPESPVFTLCPSTDQWESPPSIKGNGPELQRHGTWKAGSSLVSFPAGCPVPECLAREIILQIFVG